MCYSARLKERTPRAVDTRKIRLRCSPIDVMKHVRSHNTALTSRTWRWRIYFISYRIHLVVHCVSEHCIDHDRNRYEDRSANGVLREFRAIFSIKEIFQSFHLNNSIAAIVSETGLNREAQKAPRSWPRGFARTLTSCWLPAPLRQYRRFRR